MNHLETFCRQVKARSTDHRAAIARLHPSGPPSQIISILRQELDSLVRVIYLLSISDMAYRTKLIKASVEGHKWSKHGSRRRITDRDMVDFANTLHGWAESVYRFGCAFIHLSNFHDYRQRDPLDQITADERKALLRHMRNYHGGPHQPKPQFVDLLPYLPMVFDKIAGNLDCYLRDLERGGTL